MTEAPYESYKTTTLPWLEALPVDWSESRLGYETWVRARLGWKGLKADEYVDSGFAFLSTPNIKRRDIDFERVNFITRERYDESPEIKLTTDDVLLAKDGSTLGTVNVVRELPVPATVNSSIAVLTPGPRCQGRYVHYLIQSELIQSRIEMLKGGMGVPHLFQDDIRRMPIPFPPYEVQARIVDYLDGETAKIDELIGQKERLIELLAEKRQAIITHAVTKGLDPAAPTKPSGIPWLGEVPSHWTVPQLGMHAKVGNGSTPNRDTAEYWSGGEIPWLNSSHVNREEITDADQFVSEAATAECHLPLVEAESLLIGLTGQGRTRGMTSILRFPATINQHVAYVTPEKSVWNPEYLLWFLRSSYDRLRELSDENGSTKGALTCSAIKKLNIALPHLSEQDAIAAYISEQLASLDRIVAASTAAVELLRERRSALISAAVTGTIDVRKEAS